MRTLSVVVSVSLDGVMQAPGRSDEDVRGGFDRGGWAAAYGDSVLGQKMGEGLQKEAELLFGRRTYQDFAGIWPQQTGNPFTSVLNKAQKYVASRTLREPLPWQNSTLLAGDAARSVAALKGSSGPDLIVLGCGDLVQSLRRGGLVDEYLLLIHPLLLGEGSRLFPDGPPADFRLIESLSTTTGVIIATYRPA
ncbi:MAG: dihydrofolate reductase family protein [Nakamurella sp.]